MHKSRILLIFCLICIIFLAFHSLLLKTNIGYSEKKQKFSGLIIKEPDIRQNYTNLIIKSKKINGLILVRTPLYPEYQYGDSLELECELQKPQNSDNFNYEKYLAVSDIYYLCYQPEIKLIEKNQGNIFLEYLYRFKNYCLQIIENIWVMPVSAFMAGLLLGLKKSLPSEIIDEFTRTGTIHILVVSGSHLVVFSVLIKEILKHLYVNRKKQFFLVSLTLILYVTLTGLSAAAIRACLLAILVMLVERLGRARNIFNILVFTCFLMILQNVNIIFYDVGFQLSFAATIGLIYFAKPIERCLFFMPKFFNIRNLLAQTLAAIFLTTPIIWWHFQRISLIAPLANLLIVPLISAVMIFGLITVIIGAIWPIVGQYLGYLVAVLVQLILIINHWLAQISWAQI